jgi:hypothetical protein
LVVSLLRKLWGKLASPKRHLRRSIDRGGETSAQRPFPTAADPLKLPSTNTKPKVPCKFLSETIFKKMSSAAVTVSLEDLKDGIPSRPHKGRPLIRKFLLNQPATGNVSFSALEEAFGPESLGIIIVKDVHEEFVALRHRLLSYSSYLGNLPQFRLGHALISPNNHLTSNAK